MAAVLPEEEGQLFGQFRQLFQENPAPMYVFDTQSLDFLEVNEAALKQYGYSRNEFLSLCVTDIRSEKEAARLRQTLLDMPDIIYYDHGRWLHKRKSGDFFFVHIYAHGMQFRGRPARFVMAIDIDAEVHAEKALQEKTAEVTDILESIADGFLAVNTQWEVTFINREAEEMLRCPKEELTGRNLWSRFPEAVGSRFYIAYHKVMHERIAVRFEEYYEELALWVSVRAFPTKDGIAVYFADITEARRIRDQISQNEQNLLAIINNTKDIIWSIDRDYRIISANEPFHQRMELVAGKRIDRISQGDFPAANRDAWVGYYQRAFAGESFKTTWYEKIAGNDVYEEISLNPILDAGRNIVGVSCISRDITENYLYTKRIEEQNEQLRRIAWIQSHEVRGPLSDIMGLVGLMQDGTAGEDKDTVISLIGAAAGRLDDVIRKTVTETALKQ